MATKFWHYSHEPNLNELDPAHYGKNKSVSPEYKQGFKHMRPRTYVYLKDNPEGVIASGRHRYEGEMPEHFKLYDLGQDPDKIRDHVAQKTGAMGSALYDEMEHEMFRRGFHGYHNSASPLAHAAAVFHKLPVKPMAKGEDSSPKKNFLHAGDLDHHLRTSNYALMSPHASFRSPEENKAATKNFLKDVTGMGYKFTPVQGVWSGVPEQSFMVHGMKPEHAQHLSSKYGQEAHIMSEAGKHTLHFNRKGQEPVLGQGHDLLSEGNQDHSHIMTKEGPVRFRLNFGSPTQKAELEKGAMKRLAPYKPEQSIEAVGGIKNSTRPQPGSERDSIEQWQSGDSRKVRNQIPKLSGPARQRALRKLGAQTQMRVNPSNGEAEFLLHRGHSPDEKFGASHKIDTSSWTPDHQIAHDFAGDYQVNSQGENTGHNVTSAWFPESDIHHIPNQVGPWLNERNVPGNGGKKKLAPKFGHEHEIIIRSNHKGQLAKPEEIPSVDRFQNIKGPDDAINARAGLKPVLADEGFRSANQLIADRLRARRKK